MGTPVTGSDALAAALYLQVSVSPSRPDRAPESLPALGGDVLPPPVLAGGNCISLANGAAPSQIQLAFATAGWVSITPTASGSVSVRLAPMSAPLDLTGGPAFAVGGGHTVYLTVTAAGTAPLISLPPGATTVCGVGAWIRLSAASRAVTAAADGLDEIVAGVSQRRTNW